MRNGNRRSGSISINHQLTNLNKCGKLHLCIRNSTILALSRQAIVDHLCFYVLCLSYFSRLFIAALWSPAGKGLTSWLLFVVFNCVFVTFPCGILGQVWYLIVSIPDLCRLSYFVYIACSCLYLFSTKG